MFHSSAFAIAAGVVSVGAAAAGTAISMNASQQAARAQAGAGKKLSKQQQQATEQLQRGLKKVKAPKFNVGADIADAERITGYNLSQLERIYPGAGSQRELASRAITDYMRGEIPEDVRAQTMRNVAELAGAGFQPTAQGGPSGFQAPQGLLARNLGLTSLQLQQYGMGASMDWQRLAGAFIESPLQVGQARLGFEKAAADIEMQKAATLYGSEVNLGQTQYGIATENIASRLATGQALAGGIQGLGQAAAGGISGVGSALAARQAAQGMGTTYGSFASAQQAAPFAGSISQVYGMGYVPRATPV